VRSTKLARWWQASSPTPRWGYLECYRARAHLGIIPQFLPIPSTQGTITVTTLVLSVLSDLVSVACIGSGSDTGIVRQNLQKSGKNKRTPEADYYSVIAEYVADDNFGPIGEGGCTACARVSDTRCGTCVIWAAYLQCGCSHSLQWFPILNFSRHERWI
jgi:hypothetical protein